MISINTPKSYKLLFLTLVLFLICNSVCSAVGAGGALSIFSSNYQRRANTNPINKALSPNFYNSENTRKSKSSYSNRSVNSLSSSISNNDKNCPLECVCQGLSIDCSNRGLRFVPKNIPLNVIKV